MIVVVIMISMLQLDFKCSLGGKNWATAHILRKHVCFSIFAAKLAKESSGGLMILYNMFKHHMVKGNFRESTAHVQKKQKTKQSVILLI